MQAVGHQNHINPTQTSPVFPPLPWCATSGVANVAATAYWVGAWPSTYYLYWLAKDVVLFTLRWLLYKSEGMHYM